MEKISNIPLFHDVANGDMHAGGAHHPRESTVARTRESTQSHHDAQAPRLTSREAELRVDSILNPRDGRAETIGVLPEGLEESIAKHGLVEPLIVTSLGNNLFRLISGERRLEALRNLSRPTARVSVLQTEDNRVLSEAEERRLTLTSNLKNASLDMVTKTTQIRNYIATELNMSPDETRRLLERMQKNPSLLEGDPAAQKAQLLFDQLGENRVTFTKTHLPILNLPPELKLEVGRNRLGYTKAHWIARIQDEDVRRAFMNEAIDQKLSKAVIASRVRSLTGTYPKPRKQDAFDHPIRELNQLSRILREYRKTLPPEFAEVINAELAKLINKLVREVSSRTLGVKNINAGNAQTGPASPGTLDNRVPAEDDLPF